MRSNQLSYASLSRNTRFLLFEARSCEYGLAAVRDDRIRTYNIPIPKKSEPIFLDLQGFLKIFCPKTMLSRKGIEHIRFSPANICPSISQKPCNIRILLRLFASSCLNICEVKTVPPCGEKIFDGFLRGGAKESADFSSHAPHKLAEIYRRRAYVFDSLAATHTQMPKNEEIY